MQKANTLSRLTEAKNSFVARAIVMAVSLFLVAFSLGAPGAAFAEDAESQANEPAALADQNAALVGGASVTATQAENAQTNVANPNNNVAQTSNASANNISNTQGANNATAAALGGQDVQSSGAVSANVENSNVENSSASTSNSVLAPSTSGSASGADAAAPATNTAITPAVEESVQPAADSPHRLNLSFKLLYQGPDFADGYEIGYGVSDSFVCANGDSHASTSASNHMISMVDLIAHRNILMNYLRVGFEIRGWTTSLDPSAPVYSFDGDMAACMDGATIYIVATEAGPAATEFVLNYNANGGTNAPESQTAIVAEDEYTFTISDITPTREGYTFIGWALNSFTSLPYYAPGSTVTVDASATLYAVWQINDQVELNYYVDNVLYGTTEAYAQGSGTIVKGCDLTKEGYRFAGWSLYPMDDVVQYRVGDSLVMDGNKDLYAVWIRVFSVTYTDGNGGTIFNDQVISGVENGSLVPACPVQVPSSIVRDGNTYVFGGWDTDRELPVLDDMVITALWKLDSNNNGIPDEDEATFSVIYTDGVNGTAFGDYVISDLLFGASTPLYRAPQREGYLFMGWSPSVAPTVTGNTIYTAIWVEDRNNNNIPDSEEPTYTILYVNDVTGETLQSITNILGGLGTPQYAGPRPTMTGYVFNGWAPDTNRLVNPDDADALGYIVYTALWLADVNNNGIADVDEARYTVTFTDGANGTVFSDQVSSGLLIGLAAPQFMGSTPVRQGYIFAGWSSEPTQLVVGDATYTAQWLADVNGNGVADIEEPTYTITYTDGANGAAFADQVTSGVLGGLAMPQFVGTPTRTGYTFVGWSSDIAETVSGDVTYTALWEAVEPDPTPGPDDPNPTPAPGDEDDPAPAPGDNTGDNGSTGGNTPGGNGGNGSAGNTGGNTAGGNGSTGNTGGNTAGGNGSTTTPTNPGSTTSGAGTGAGTAGTTIADDATPLAAPGTTEAEGTDGETADDQTAADEAAADENAAGTEIADDENPLAAQADHSSSWLSWLLTVGLLAAAFFIVFALVRRRKNSREQQ